MVAVNKALKIKSTMNCGAYAQKLKIVLGVHLFFKRLAA
jgi:hypothetical protein